MKRRSAEHSSESAIGPEVHEVGEAGSIGDSTDILNQPVGSSRHDHVTSSVNSNSKESRVLRSTSFTQTSPRENSPVTLNRDSDQAIQPKSQRDIGLIEPTVSIIPPNNTAWPAASNNRPKNLDWCRWPVCMAFHLNQVCPFGEYSCPDVHASSEFSDVINDKGLVRICFDALGVGGRMCLRKPGTCRFFHAPAHIRYQLLEIRHGNRLAYRRRVPGGHEIGFVNPGNQLHTSRVKRETWQQEYDEQELAASSDNDLEQSNNHEITLGIAILASVVAHLLESRLQQIPGTANKMLAALCGEALQDLSVDAVCSKMCAPSVNTTVEEVTQDRLNWPLNEC
ncbi:sphingosine phosphate lyase [Clonorchis sinensis]|uniref:Sphingosine phosphate lyase n=1 Tax=Clonorchis sinensis TaxID=79923 RepID=G7YXK5_CLOSI|nr:sphingosine phosphate lyase [Clonorchis sinensis]